MKPKKETEKKGRIDNKKKNGKEEEELHKEINPGHVSNGPMTLPAWEIYPPTTIHHHPTDLRFFLYFFESARFLLSVSGFLSYRQRLFESKWKNFDYFQMARDSSRFAWFLIATD